MAAHLGPMAGTKELDPEGSYGYAVYAGSCSFLIINYSFYHRRVRMKKKGFFGFVRMVLAAGLALVFVQGSFAQSADFEIKDGVLVKYRGKAAEVVVPDGVTSIGKEAFARCESLITVNIPAGVTSIEDFAFSWCESLTTVDIPIGVTSIGRSTFLWCVSLTTVNIPVGVTSIEHSAFSNCVSLTTVDIPASVTSIEDSAFFDCDSLTAVYIPAGVTSIGRSAFSVCSGLTRFSVDPGNSRYADRDGVLFNKAGTELIQYPLGKPGTSYSIPAGVTSIGDAAFRSCENLTTVNIPASVTSIGDAVFSECENLTVIRLPASTPPALGKDGLWPPSWNSMPPPFVIYVPAASVDAYKNAPDWKDYAGRIQAAP
jgi:hypothetical protein